MKAVTTVPVLMTYDELMDSGKLEALRDSNYPVYAVIYKETFGEYPAGSDGLVGEYAADNIRADRNAYRVKRLVAMNYDELTQNGGLGELRKLDPEAYKTKMAQIEGNPMPGTNKSFFS